MPNNAEQNAVISMYARNAGMILAVGTLGLAHLAKSGYVEWSWVLNSAILCGLCLTVRYFSTKH